MAGFYSTTAWVRIRARQLAREPLCRSCGAIAREVDHIKPISAGGAKRDPRNLQSLCESCHSEKTGRERNGLKWTPRKHRGCDEHGAPLDPTHPWHVVQTDRAPPPPDDGDPHLIEAVQEPGGVRSLRFSPPDRRGSQNRT